MSIESIVQAIDQALPSYRPIGHHDSVFGVAVGDNLEDWHSVNGIASQYWLPKLEAQLSKICHVPHVVPTNSGTSALHLALLALGIKPGEEVIVPSLTFVGTVNAITYVGAIPCLIDTGLVLTAKTLRDFLENGTREGYPKGRLNSKTNRLISAVVAVDLLGFPADLRELRDVADEFSLHLIEDAAQALGSYIDGRGCGSYCSAAIISFNSNKIVTGHGGGALITKDEALAKRARHLGNTARIEHPWEISHTEIGYNYRMSSLTAAVICAQLDQFDIILAKKRLLLKKYIEALSEESEACVLMQESDQKQANYWLISIYVTYGIKNDLLKALHEKGILARSLPTPMHKLPMFKYKYSCDYPMPTSELWYDSVISLPSGLALV